MAETAAKKTAKTAATAAGKAAGQRPRLMLMDGHSLAYRAFFALPAENFTTATGQPTNAIYGFASMLANTLRDEAPTHFAVAFDVSRKTWRSQEFPEYKANRSKTPDEFKGQVELIGELLDAMHVERFAVDGFEADDIIATLATQAEAAGFEVLIVTGDRDSFQLVSDHVTVLYPTKGVSELTRFTPEKVEEKYGLTPAAVPGLRGPARRPVGQPAGHPRRRREDRREVDQPVRVVRRAGGARRGGQGQGRAELPGPPGRRQAQPSSHRDGARTSSCPRRSPTWSARRTTARPSRWSWTPWSSATRRCASGSSPSTRAARTPRRTPAPTEGIALDGAVLGSGELAPWLAEHGKAVLGHRHRRHLEAGHRHGHEVALAAAGGAAAWFDPAQLDESDDKAFAAWLADAAKPKVIHDAKGALRVFAEHGWDRIEGITMDTALAAYLVKPGRRSFALDALSLEYLGRELAPAAAADGQLAFGADEERRGRGADGAGPHHPRPRHGLRREACRRSAPATC